MGARGYVVRGKDGAGYSVTPYGPNGGTARTGEHGKPAYVFDAFDVAQEAHARMARNGYADVAIFRVRDGGTEERLPSYEEALALLDQSRGRALVNRMADAIKDREALGRLVREEWIAWAKEQPSSKASWLVPWEGLSEPDKEVDRRIGVRLAALMPDQIDPLAALEAAERRLLEAGGWVEIESAVWMDPRDHWHGNQGEAVDIARLRMMGERLAAKGGA